MGVSKKSITLLQKKAEKALKQAVTQVIKELAAMGQSVAIWKNGKVIKISAKTLLRNKK